MENAEQVIIVNVKLDREDVGEMNTLYLKATQNRRWNWSRFVITAVIVLLLLLILFLLHLFTETATSTSFSEFNKVFTVLVTLSLVYVVLFIIYKLGMPVLAGKLGKKQFDSNKILQKETQYTISADSITSRSESASLQLTYDEIYKIMETTKYLFIYESTQMASILPKRCFRSERELQEAVKLLKEKIPINKYEVYKF